jgi:HTH-type transcriptional regulator/antitoxin HigA
MKLNINSEWLLRMAEKEGNQFVSVGGLVTPIEVNVGVKTPRAMKPLDWSRLFPVSVMRKLKFSLPEGVSDSDALLKFFDVRSPDAWRVKWSDYAVAFRQTQKFDFRLEALAAWVREAEIIANQIPLAEFDEAKLRASLDELRRVTRGDVQEGLDRAQLICSKAGVALVLVHELPGTRISGCARWLSDKQAMVGLTIRYKWADQLWFTFFHEVAHILLHRRRRLFVIDNAADDMGDDVVDPDMARYEEEADRFAADTLIPPAALAEFLHLHGKTLTNDEIHEFAEFLGVGPGIVIGRLQHDGVLRQWQGNKLRQKLESHFITED